MSNTVRLVNGGTIHVRTGVIQGIGPQGPRGVAGPQGADGPAGPPGEQGPIGQILQLGTKKTMNSSNSIAANTDTTIAFGYIDYDGLSFVKSTANMGFDAAGDYMINVWLGFADATAGYRDIWLKTGTETIARTSRTAVAGAICYADLSFPYRSTGSGEIVNVLARSSAATTASVGSWAVTRMGSGPQGEAGPVGPQGPIGPVGATGATGPTGSASGGFATYADLLP